MSKANRAVKEVSTFLKQFKNFMELDEQLMEAGSLENMIHTRKLELEALEARVGTISDQLQLADAQAKQVGDDAAAKAAALISMAEQRLSDAVAAKDAGEAFLLQARTQAAELVAEAETTKAAAAAEAHARLAKAREEADRIVATLSEASAAQSAHLEQLRKTASRLG